MQTTRHLLRHAARSLLTPMVALVLLLGGDSTGTAALTNLNGPIVVTTTSDTTAAGQTTLRDAITLANSLSGYVTISFDPNVFAAHETIMLGGTDLIITSSVTITGPAAGVTVDGNKASRVLTIASGATTPSVTIGGLTVANGNHSGIFVGGGALTLENCTVSQNSCVGGESSGNGGGIFTQGNLTLRNCTITGNSADDNGGGVYVGQLATASFSGCTIANNTTTHGSGAGLRNDGRLSIRSSTIAKNTSNGPNGGGILNFGGTLTVTNSTISGNHADSGGESNGGGIVNYVSRMTLISCTITGNTCSGTDSAGGVRCLNSNAGGWSTTVSNTIIAGNTGAGGAAADVNSAGGDGFLSKGYNLIGDGSGSTGFTQGTLHDQVGTTANPIDPQLDPLANNGGPTLTHALRTSPIVSPAIDAGNTDQDDDQRGLLRPIDDPNAPNGSGNLTDIGAVELGATVTPVLQTGPNFVVNTTGDDDGQATTTNTSLREAIKAADGLAPGTATITFDPTVFATAQTITLGGSDLLILHAMTITGPGADKLTISGNNQSRIFTVNTADGLNTISGLTVTGGNGASSVLQRFGGGICNLGDLLLVDCTITGNSALRGGGVYTYGTLTMRGCTISNNTALDSGGGGVDSSLSASMTNCTISGNHSDRAAGGNAGGVSNARGAMTISNCTITGNTAAGSKGSGGVRSGAFGGAGSITVRNSIIAGNTGTGGATADVSDASGATTISEGFNLIGDGAGSSSFVNGNNHDQVGTTANPLDPRLGPLANNGGSTPTHALLAFSPAIDKGGPIVRGGLAFGVNNDQRGLMRPVNLPDGAYPNAANGDGRDIGALEAQVEPPLPPYAGVDDAVAGTTHGVTRIYPLANDVSPGGRPLSLLSVSNPAIHIDGRSLIIPAGFTGTFTYTFTDGTTVGQATVTVTYGAEVLNARTYSGLLLDPHGAISGAVDATFTATGRFASVRMTVGTRVVRFLVPFPAGSNMGSRFLGFGELTLTRNMDGTVSASFANSGDLLSGVLLPRKAAVLAGRYNAALASIDAAIPGGGYLFADTVSTSAALLIGRLPDGKVFAASTSVRDDGTVAFHSIVRRGVNPIELVGGELVFADLTATDLTGEVAWAKPVQRPGVRGLHLGGVNTILTVNGCQFTRQPLPTGTGVLSLSGGNLAVDEDTAVTVTAGRPTVPTGTLRSWLTYPNLGIFGARVKVPGLPIPVYGAGVYLPKSNSAWGFFPGTTVGGRIELTPR
jgi:CSLREA domain-containing protein